MHETPSLLPESLPRSFFHDAANIWPSTQRGSGAEGHAYRVFPCVRGIIPGEALRKSSGRILSLGGNPEIQMKLVAPTAVLRGGFLLCTTSVYGTADYAKKEKKICTYCHAKMSSEKAEMAKNLNDTATATKGLIILWPNARLLSKEYFNRLAKRG